MKLSNALSKQLPKLYFEHAVIALFITTFLLYAFFSGYSFKTGVPDSVVFSQSVLDGIDVSKRVKLFHTLVLLFLPSIALVYFLLFKLNRTLHINTNQLIALSQISIGGFFSVFMNVMRWEMDVLMNTIFVILFLRILFYGVGNIKRKQYKLFSNDTFLNYIFASAFLLYFGLFFWENNNNSFPYSFLLVYTLSCLLIAFVLHAMYFWLGSVRRLLYLLIPFSLIPFIVFFVLELAVYLKINYDYLLRFKVLFSSIWGVCFLWCLFHAKFKKPIWQGRRLMDQLMMPAIVFGSAFYFFYDPFPFQTTETFELANPANSLLRIFEYNQIPFFDFLSSHNLSEQWYGVIHSLIFGFQPNLDFLVYRFFNHLVFVFVLYIFLKKLFDTSESAVLFLLCFPFIFMAFFSHITLPVIIVFLVIRALKNQKWIDYTWIGLGVIILILWRMDTGWAGMIATFFFIPLLFFVYRHQPNWRKILTGFGIALLLLGVGFIISFLLRDPGQIIENLRAAFHYFGATQAHGYSKIASSFPHQFYIYHFLFPLASLIFVSLLVFQIRKMKMKTPDKSNLSGLFSIFFFLLYLANAQRGLVRHSFLAGTELFLISTFYVALALFITFFLEQKHKSYNRYVTFFATITLVFLILKFFPIGNQNTLFAKVTLDSGIKNFDSKLLNTGSGQRTIPDSTFNQNYYEDLKLFMDENFHSEATFLDFTNSPMLYYYCKRPIPGYFNQNLQNTVNDYLQLHYLKYIDPVKVPIVVFSNIEPSWFDATDGVPNVMRYYMIAEYIFAHYEPFAVINQKNIWISKGAELKNYFNFPESGFDQVKKYDYKKAAFYTGRFYEHNPADYLDTLFFSKESWEHFSKHLKVKIPEIADEKKHAYICIRIDSENDFENLNVKLLSGNTVLGEYSFDGFKGGRKYYYLRPGNHYPYFLRDFDTMEIETREGMYIKEISILKDTRFENNETDFIR